MTSRPGHLVSLGTVMVDVITSVGTLPDRGGDTIADRAWTAVGGGFNLMLAARRQGMSVTYAGMLGTGPFGAMVATALDVAGIEHPLVPIPLQDSGFVIAMIDAEGERTFVTAPGAEATLRRDQLERIPISGSDSLVISGYGLLHAANRDAVLDRLDRLDPLTTVFYDPGPLGPGLPADVRDRLGVRVDWFSCNDREARLLASTNDIPAAAAAIAGTLTRGGVIVRVGPGGCLLLPFGGKAATVPGFSVNAVDTNGAGDAHLGAFVAAVAAGCAPVSAARRANAVAAIAVTRPGPAASPTQVEVDDFLRAAVGL